MKFKGDWAFIEKRHSSVTRTQVINGSVFEFGDCSMKGPGELSGSVCSVDVEGRSIIVSTPDALAVDGSLIGLVLLVENSDYICNSSYEITDVRMAGEGKYEIVLGGMDFLLSEGIVMEANGTRLLTDTPMLKLETVRDLFDGKVIASVRGEMGTRLDSAEKGKLLLKEGTDAGFSAGSPFYIYDLGPGDGWRVPAAWYTEA